MCVRIRFSVLAFSILFLTENVFACRYETGAEFFFMPGTTKLTWDSAQRLEKWNRTISKFHSIFSAEVKGHTSLNEVPVKDQQHLSSERAKMVFQRLTSLKIPSQEIFVYGVGSREQYSENPDDSRSMNVEVNLAAFITKPIKNKLCGMCTCFEDNPELMKEIHENSNPPR